MPPSSSVNVMKLHLQLHLCLVQPESRIQYFDFAFASFATRDWWIVIMAVSSYSLPSAGLFLQFFAIWPALPHLKHFLFQLQLFAKCPCLSHVSHFLALSLWSICNANSLCFSCCKLRDSREISLAMTSAKLRLFSKVYSVVTSYALGKPQSKAFFCSAQNTLWLTPSSLLVSSTIRI